MEIYQIAQNLAQKIKRFAKHIMSYHIEFSLIQIDSNQNPPPHSTKIFGTIIQTQR